MGLVEALSKDACHLSKAPSPRATPSAAEGWSWRRETNREAHLDQIFGQTDTTFGRRMQTICSTYMMHMTLCLPFTPHPGGWCDVRMRRTGSRVRPPALAAD